MLGAIHTGKMLSSYESAVRTYLYEYVVSDGSSKVYRQV